MTDHSNLFHEALVRIHDITTNKPLNMQSWQDVREVDKVLAKARRADLKAGKFAGLRIRERNCQ
jgi:hypothetical protein